MEYEYIRIKLSHPLILQKKSWQFNTANLPLWYPSKWSCVLLTNLPNLNKNKAAPPPMQSFHLLNDGEMREWWLTSCSVMMVKWSSMMVKWVYDHELISPSLTSISPSLTSISPSLTSILPSLAWSKPSFAHITIIEKLHRLQWAHNKKSIPL